jgi:hypothetical protein
MRCACAYAARHPGATWTNASTSCHSCDVDPEPPVTPPPPVQCWRPQRVVTKPHTPWWLDGTRGGWASRVALRAFLVFFLSALSDDGSHVAWAYVPDALRCHVIAVAGCGLRWWADEGCDPPVRGAERRTRGDVDVIITRLQIILPKEWPTRLIAIADACGGFKNGARIMTLMEWKWHRNARREAPTRRVNRCRIPHVFPVKKKWQRWWQVGVANYISLMYLFFFLLNFDTTTFSSSFFWIRILAPAVSKWYWYNLFFRRKLSRYLQIIYDSVIFNYPSDRRATIFFVVNSWYLMLTLG